MRVRVLLQITGDDGTASAVEEVALFEKVTEHPEDLGVSIAEGKVVMAVIQRRTVNAQAAAWAERHRSCEACGERRRSKGSYPVTACYVGLAHGYDSKPKRRLFNILKSQGLQANQDVTFLTDGGEEVRALTEFVTPASEHVLDWFHITMRVTVLEQYARGVGHHDGAAGRSPAGRSGTDQVVALAWQSASCSGSDRVLRR
jgi:hypothetical protein